MYVVYLSDRVIGRFFNREDLEEGLMKLLGGAGEGFEDMVRIASVAFSISLKTFRETQSIAEAMLVA